MKTHTTAYTRRSILAVSGTALASLSAGCFGIFGGEKQIKLGGKAAGWQGKEPKETKDKQNPTLNMKERTTYGITWENLDGQQHQLLVLKKNGDVVKKSDPSSKKGETRKISVKATSDLGTYRCQYHSNAMQGKISVTK